MCRNIKEANVSYRPESRQFRTPCRPTAPSAISHSMPCRISCNPTILYKPLNEGIRYVGADADTSPNELRLCVLHILRYLFKYVLE